jgi:hypothetical protein
MRRIFGAAGLQTAVARSPTTPDTPVHLDSAKPRLGSRQQQQQQPSTPTREQSSDDEDWDSIKLPFANSGVSTSPSSASLSPGSSAAMTVPSEKGERVADSREHLIIELLAGQAMVEVDQGRWGILSWEQVEDLRLVSGVGSADRELKAANSSIRNTKRP